MILIISKSRKEALSISDALFFMGNLSVAATPSEALSEISTVFRAAVIVNPDSLADSKEYVERLHSYVSEIPVFALGATKNAEVFNKNLPPDTSTPQLISEIYEYTLENDLPVPGTYRLAGFDLSSYLKTPVYFFTGLPITRTEAMLARTLIRFYPMPLKADQIIKYAFRQSRLPSAASIRTHISIINRKFRKISGRNMIQMINGNGYVILTPEISEKIPTTAK